MQGFLRGSTAKHSWMEEAQADCPNDTLGRRGTAGVPAPLRGPRVGRLSVSQSWLRLHLKLGESDQGAVRRPCKARKGEAAARPRERHKPLPSQKRFQDKAHPGPPRWEGLVPLREPPARLRVRSQAAGTKRADLQPGAGRRRGGTGPPSAATRHPDGGWGRCPPPLAAMARRPARATHPPPLPPRPLSSRPPRRYPPGPHLAPPAALAPV